MKRTYWIFIALIFTLACGLLAPNQTPPAPALVTQTSTAPDVSPVAPATPAVLPATSGIRLYISATMHIETKSDSWPRDVNAFLAFLEAATNAGMRWSIGADVGWLEGGVRVQEIIQRTSAMGVQWDVHAHEAADRAKAAYLLAQYGVTPTSVVSGMRIDEFDELSQVLTYQGYAWTPQVVWGGANCVGHKPGCDDVSIALYRPASSAQYDVHDPNGNLIRVGNTDHQIVTAEQLIAQIKEGQYSVPVLEFTIMVEPENLQIVNSEDGLDELLAFVERAKLESSVSFATIEETAQAWAAAGGVAVNFIP